LDVTAESGSATAGVSKFTSAAKTARNQVRTRLFDYTESSS